MCASKPIRYRTTGRKNGKQRMPNIIFLETFILLFPFLHCAFSNSSESLMKSKEMLAISTKKNLRTLALFQNMLSKIYIAMLQQKHYISVKTRRLVWCI